LNIGLFAHEGHQPLPSKGVLVDPAKGHITLSSKALKAIGVATQEISDGNVSSPINVFAETVVPWQAKAIGSAQISGRITKLLVRPGDFVNKGQVVAELSSRELETFRLEYLQAQKELQLNSQLLEITRPSASAGAVPMQRLLELENAYQQTINEIEIAKIRARTLGIPLSDLGINEKDSINHSIRSPLTGKIVHSDLTEGKYVEAFEHLFEIVNGDTTWVRLQLLEKDIFKVQVGQQVELEFPDSKLKFQSSIERIDAGLQSKTKVAWAWLTVSDPLLVPGLVGHAVIHTSTQQKTLTVPTTAIFSDGLQNYVFVEEASTRTSAEYRKRNVTIGNRRLINATQSTESVEIIRGDVYPGDRIVVTGGHELSNLFFLGVLKLSESDRKRLGLVTSVASERSIADVVELPATAILPPENRSIVSSQLDGTIYSHSLSPGREVRVGELLLEIASPEFQTLQLDLLKTALDAELSHQRLLRLEQLKSDTLPRRTIAEIRAQADKSESRLESLKRQLSALGISPIEIDAMVKEKNIMNFLPVRAAIDGKITTWNGALGESVIANQSLVEIQNLDAMWIEAHVPSGLMGKIHVSSGGTASVLSNPEARFPVTVNRVSPIVSGSTRTQQIWLSFDEPNADFQLRDGMAISVLLKLTSGHSGLAIPTTAVLRDGIRHYVFVQTANDYIERRRITIGRSDGEFIEVLDGVELGDRVISSGGQELQRAFASLR
jgi:RND family efflux transporter MFP subunit